MGFFFSPFGENLVQHSFEFVIFFVQMSHIHNKYKSFSLNGLLISKAGEESGINIFLPVAQRICIFFPKNIDSVVKL